MSLALHDLLLCCRGLQSDKATERKKEAEHFRRLLRSPETVQELDRTSGSKAKTSGSKQLTWDTIFKFVQRYVQKESESHQSSRSNVSATTLATRQKKMAEVCSLVKYFIRCANKRGPRLQCEELLKHVMEVLQNTYSCSTYGADYSSLLVKDIFSVRKYWCAITPQQWQSILELYCNLYNSSSKSINRVLVSRAIHTVVQGCCMQTDEVNTILFSFFSKALKEKQLMVLEHLVSALNIFLRTAALNWRIRVCRLGEELLPTVMYVWGDMRPSAALREEIVEFFNLQMCVHHPKGATTQDEGALADDWSRWRTLLYDLYDALVREISQIGSRGKYTTGNRHVAVKDNLIELTADICHQLFTDDGNPHMVEVSQSSLRATHVGSPTRGTASKRRRIEMGWDVLRDRLQPQHNDFDVIPWLQITAVLTSKYPSMLSGKELVPLILVLQQLLAEQRRGERGLYVLRCLKKVARCQALHPQTALVHRAELERLWARVWALAMRGVSLPQTESVCLDLLNSIVHSGLINSDREFWKLFSSTPAECLVNCLSQLTGVLTGYISTGFLSEEDACRSPLFNKAKVNIYIYQTQHEMYNYHLTVPIYINTGQITPLADSHLAPQDLALLSALEFLSECGSIHPVHGLLFKPQEVRRRLLQLLETEQIDFTKALHLNMYLVLLRKLPVEDSLSPQEFDSLLRPLADLCYLNVQDQEISAAVLQSLLPSIRVLGKTCHVPEEMRHVQGSLLQVVSGYWLESLLKCIATVRAALVQCLVALLEADPLCTWAKVKDDPVFVVLPSYLADSHHQVRMLVAMSLERCVSRKMLPLKHQQAAFENIYLKAQEGMRPQGSGPSEDQQDEINNRRATLLKSLSVVLCCSPVCEKQSLFALFQSYKENNVEEQLIKKMLYNVSRVLGYKSVKTLVSFHLHYLVTEWLTQRQSDDRYTLGSFPYTLLDHDTVKDFYSSAHQVLVPHLVFLDDFEQVKSIGRCLQKDWKDLLADCFPRIMVNILPHFALLVQDEQIAQQREKARRVHNLLKEPNFLGKQQIDSLIRSNLADIVVELLMTLYEGNGGESAGGDLKQFTGELDPVPNPPYFSSYVIKETLDYLSKCHSSNHKSLVAILSKSPISIQRILLAVCERAAETTNRYERHRILLMYHLFVNLLLREVKDGLGGAWAFVLRDIIYTLIHQINSRPSQCDEVSNRSLSLCCDLLTSVCGAALQFCDDALDCHLQVIVGTLTAQMISHPKISQPVLGLLEFLVIENQQKLKKAISRLESFPNIPEFRELRFVIRITPSILPLQEIGHFLSVTSCDSLPLTRLEGLKQLTRRLHENKVQIRELLKECHADPSDSVLVKLVLNLLQLCKLAANHPEVAGSCLGELGPVDFSSYALLHGRDPLYEKAVSLFSSSESQCLYIILNCINDALTHHIEVKRAAIQCAKSILASPSGLNFWEQHKDNRDPIIFINVGPSRNGEGTGAKEKLESQEIWIPQAGGHNAWLKTLCTALLDSGGVRMEALLLSRPLCVVSVDCCQRLLPLIVHSILLDDSDGEWRMLLSSHVQDFFSFCSRSAQASSRSVTPHNSDSDSDTVNKGLFDKSSLRTMLAVIDYLRHQQRPLEADSNSSATVCHSNFWLELNYLVVAKAAQSCSAHFTALLYTEIYVDRIKADMEATSRRINFEDNSQTFSISSLTERSIVDTDISLQELLIEVYQSIGEPDSLYGCGGETMTSPLTRIRTYEHEAMWERSLTAYDLHCSLPEVTRQVGILEGLKNMSLSNILSIYLKGLESEGVEWGTELRELRFQAAWRLTQWDCELSERSETSPPGFHESVFCAIQALKDKEFSMFDHTLRQIRVAEVGELCRGSLEAVSSLYPALRDLQGIIVLSAKTLAFRPFSDVALSEVCNQWRQHSQLLLDSDFALVEPILAIRSAAQNTLLSKEEDPVSAQCLSSALCDHLMELSRLARKAGNTQVPSCACVDGGNVPLPVSTWQLEEAQVFWAKGEQGLALGLLRQIVLKLEEKVDFDTALAPIYAECLRLCGNWLAETCLDSPGVILENYLERVRFLTGVLDSRLQSQRTEAFLSLARFSDAQYQSIKKYMNSSEYDHKKTLFEKAKVEVSLLKQRNVTTNRYTKKVEEELKLDETALSNLRSDKMCFLSKAMENYIRCLEQCEEHDTWVFRLASLWLENASLKEARVKLIPSYKFLPLMYQLAARMGSKIANGNAKETRFHQVLYNLICRASLEHPHHTLFIIFALVNSNKDESFCTPRPSRNAPHLASQFDQDRVDRAQEVINAIKAKRGEMVRGIERLCDAYITLAYLDASRHKMKQNIPIPADQPIMQIKDLTEVAIPTLETKVDPSGSYENLVTVRSFLPFYHLVGGVNVPKIIDCVGSDGKDRRQLVKGRDDLRQDAVMQQVFGMCSMLLQRNADTRKRKLNIRRYKVVPFSQCSGVLEWCSGTMPIGEYLIDTSKGAHKRFRPQDLTSLECRRKMMEAPRGANDMKLDIYLSICKKFRPVFRYFCMERFLDPAVWMEKQLAYTRSVATSSIVGYIVGLGDRHIQNILIDKQTAELVHIDLGVAFEQGKILPTPETVPFRLTRDIVDGMGITGVEGVFRRCCEKTMEVMRNSQEALVTIVEVLLYDPLFDWTMNPLKAFYLQQDEQQELNATLSSTLGGEEADPFIRSFSFCSDSQSFNKVAERVLLRLQEKLKGMEQGRVLSVEGQANLLIQQAMDPRNLSRLFPGWQAWV
uniref:non-specific serine/threonine protein kinase n=1 Tax=Gouania willdenowi TaxID=441366 RepID=A0A8C5DKK5_GOUWI